MNNENAIAASPKADDWNKYWSNNRRTGLLYARLATIFRKTVIRRSLIRAFRKHVTPHSICLHAGSGRGEVDMGLLERWSIYGLDFSAEAANQYLALHSQRIPVVLGDNSFLPFRSGQFDCVFNLGVMEHFTDLEIQMMLQEFRRVLKVGGVVILFWPPVYGSTVILLRLVHTIARFFRPNFSPLHPNEISLIKSRKSVKVLLSSAGFTEIEFAFEALDLFTHEVVVARAFN